MKSSAATDNSSHHVKCDKNNINDDGNNSFIELPPNSRPLEHQIAGHFYDQSKTKYGLLQHSNGDVLKPLLNPPRGPCEEQFYIDVFCQTSKSKYNSEDLINLRKFLPHYLGTYKCQKMSYIILENIIQPFKHPCITDIKIGRITYDKEANEEKIHRMSKNSVVAEIGFQLSGWKIYRSKYYEYHDKRCVRSLNKTDILHGIAYFYGAPIHLRLDVIELVINKLNELQDYMKQQHTFVLISSSLMVVYEGDDNDQELNKSTFVDVRLIDFAHVFPQTNSNQSDENFLFGLANYIDYMKQLLDKNYVYVPIDKFEHDNKTDTKIYSCYKQLLT